MTVPLLEVHKVSKSFPGTQALSDVSFDLLPGEVHALMGENGAGKSTLMHILSGVYVPDAGEIHINGEPVQINNPRQAQDLGIGMVFQELSLVPSLSIAENVFPNRAPSRLPGVINWSQLYANTRALIAQFDVQVDVRTPVSALNITTRQIIEIVKALSLNAKILLLDEPTSALTLDEVKLLFDTIRRLKQRGIGIVYVSHRIPEVMEITDRVTVLRDGKLVGTYPTTDITPDTLIEKMVGRQLLNELLATRTQSNGGELLRAENLARKNEFAGISFAVQKGEIVGVAGLKGARRSELFRALVGAKKLQTGQVWLEGKPVKINSPMQAFAMGIAYLPEERKTDGLFVKMPLSRNIVSATLKAFARWGIMSRRRELEVSANLVDRLNIRASGLRQIVGRLSGGNQQKVMLSKWLIEKPKLLIIDEPTKGVDVGTKAEVHQLLRELADQGAGILFISSELPEILGLADRILVMYEGHLRGELLADEADEQTIMTLASGYEANHAGTEK
ncbi:MAG TPA: sugar ABC transporter ATP-binding protein [Aggregatilineaceae bacterium]|jgi:ABC-type sugar transport system ATPase subunit|nr:sugar ABC transporter ATP-binding protein [Aggregatilineaceae bacterium]